MTVPESLRGQFLIATRALRDKNFYKSVVLMVEHGSNGSMGLIVNRPSSITVQRALQEHFDLPETDEPIFIGGPVERAALFILHNLEDVDHEDRSILPGLYVGSSADAFRDVVQRIAAGDVEIKFRVFSGCAGWAPNQLESELERGDWVCLPANSDLTLNDDPYDLWDSLLKDVGREQGLMPDLDVDPECN